MIDQFEDFIKVFKAFEEEKLDYVLIGGVAVVFHGIERVTRDIDISVKMIPDNISKLRKARGLQFFCKIFRFQLRI